MLSSLLRMILLATFLGCSANFTKTSSELALREMSDGMTLTVEEVKLDAPSAALMRIIGDMMVFFVRYEDLRGVLGTEYVKLEPYAGKELTEAQQRMDLKSLSESLYVRMKEKSMQLVKDYNYMGHVVGAFLNDFIGLIEVQEILDEEEPVEASDIDDILDLERFNMAVGSFGKHDEMMAEADLLFHNLGRKDPLSKKITALQDEKDSLYVELDKVDMQIVQAASEMSQTEGEVARLALVEQSLSTFTAQTSKSSEAHTTFLQDEIWRINEALKQARKNEQDYTYRMWGPFVSMWQNDVKLAKDQVDRFTEELRVRESQLEDAKASKAVLDLDKERADVVSKKKALEAPLNNQKTVFQNLTAQRDAIVMKQKNITTQQETILEEEHAVTAKHLLDSLRAKSQFTRVSQRATVVASSVSDFTESFKAFNVAVKKLKKAKTLSQQKKIIGKLQDMKNRETLFKLLATTRLKSLLPALDQNEIGLILAGDSNDEDDLMSRKKAQLSTMALTNGEEDCSDSCGAEDEIIS